MGDAVMESDFDTIIVGGGIAGAALGMSLAQQQKVLIVERETAFRDRVRGEYLHPWGVAEARTLGLYDLLLSTCAHEARYRTTCIAGAKSAPPRDMIATTPHKTGSLQFYHPEMQDVMIASAVKAGVTVKRGVSTLHVSPGAQPAVSVREDGQERTYRANLVVGADGRDSACRKWGEFAVEHDEDRMIIAGFLFHDLKAPEDSVVSFSNPERGQYAFIFPLGKGRFRCYAGYYQQDSRRPMSGAKDADRFEAESISCGVPAEWFVGARSSGPLASFPCADSWVSHPYKNGVALVGDAAASTDPTFGCGLSLALRDVRVLSQQLLANDDIEAAAHEYAAEHDKAFASIHLQLDLMTKLLYEPGAAAASRRSRAFGRIAEDPRRRPDIPGLGPEWPVSADPYGDLFGEG